jgi:multidrug efflux pump
MALTHRWLTLIVLIATVGLTVWQYIVIPKGFFPDQDTGQLRGQIIADQSISFKAMKEKLITISDIVRKDPAVDTMLASAGAGFGGSRNNGNIFVSLKPRGHRADTADGKKPQADSKPAAGGRGPAPTGDDSAAIVLARLRKKTADVAGATMFLQASQDIRMGGRNSSAAYQYTMQSSDLNELRSWEPKIRAALISLKSITDVNSDFQDKGGLTRVVVDRDAASRLGITMSAIDAALNNAFGQRQISTIYAELTQYHVVMEADQAFTNDPDSLQHIRVKGPGGELLPLTAVAHWESAPAPLSVSHQGQFAAITFSFNVAPGFSFGDVTTQINETLANLQMPNTIQRNFAGTANVFQDSLSSQPWLVLTAVLVIYLTLGILYESFLHPLTILSTLPSAGIGALLALQVCNMEFDIMGFIGVFLLIGIVKKNAIMMIDFALEAERSRDLSPRQAIFEACELRLRPILMTTCAALLGALPLAIGFGEGSELRRPLGVAIVGGLVVSQILTLYTTPVVYLILDSMRHRFLAKRKNHPLGHLALPPEPQVS